jgi:hypothetical protein
MRPHTCIEESDRATTYTHHIIPHSHTRKGQRVVRPFMKGKILKVSHFLIVIDKVTNFHRNVLNLFIYNNSYANQAGYQ